MTKAIEVDGGAAPDAKLERLQKILAAAGIASRRKAEEINAANIRGLMEAGRRDRSRASGEGKLGVGVSPDKLDVGINAAQLDVG